MSVKNGKHGAAWTAEDDAELRRRCDGGDFLEDIAKSLGRSTESVRTRANVLGIPCRSGRKALRGTKSKSIPAAAKYRLVCLRSDGEPLETKPLAVENDALAVAAGRCCSAPGGCEVWTTGGDPQMLGRF